MFQKKIKKNVTDRVPKSNSSSLTTTHIGTLKTDSTANIPFEWSENFFYVARRASAAESLTFLRFQHY